MKKHKDPFKTRYENSPGGAVQALSEMRHALVTPKTVKPDIATPGVWFIEHDNKTSVVYLGGIPDQFGISRHTNYYDDHVQ